MGPLPDAAAGNAVRTPLEAIGSCRPSPRIVHHVVFQIRELLTFALIGSLTLAISVLGYRLHPVRFVNLVTWVLVLTVVAAGLLLIVRLLSWMGR